MRRTERNDDAGDILDRILATKRAEVDEARARTPVEAHEATARALEAPRGFVRALSSAIASGNAAVIAEVKKASPSKGLLRPHFDPVAIATSYAAHGATCLSVLTDASYFQGSIAALQAARGACALPVLRKDFVVDPYQVVESRAIGADCILLIVAALDDDALASLHARAMDLDLDVLVEVHDGDELERAKRLPMDANRTALGINNRNLRTFETRLDVTLGLLDRVPEGIVLVTESGIATPDDVARMRAAKVDAFLIGETFMRADDPGTALRALFARGAG